MPRDGKWVASFSGRWTPPPPAGGEYMVIRRAFTPGCGRERTGSPRRRAAGQRAGGRRGAGRQVNRPAADAGLVDEQPARAVAARERDRAAVAEEAVRVVNPLCRPVRLRVRDVRGRRGVPVDRGERAELVGGDPVG